MTKFVEDLSVRARRGELDEGEEQQLRQWVTASAEAQLAHRAGIEFDQEDRVLPGDDALADRIAERVLSDRRPPARHRPRAWVLVAAVLLATGAATAGPAVVRSVRSVMQGLGVGGEAGPEGAERAVPAKTRPRVIASPPVTSIPPETSAAPEAQPAPPAETVPVARRAVSDVLPSRERAQPSRVSTLYAEANRARRAGDFQTAIALYESIQRQYPGSVESGAADIPLGVMRTRAGALDLAIVHFERYLGRSPRGELAPEALWGLAQAYSGAGRHGDARRVWAELLTRYPDSTYAAVVRSRVDPESK